MALLNGPLDFNGRIGKISAYKMKGCDKTVIRVGSGPSKKQIQESPTFARTRENNAEIKGSTLLTAAVRHALFPVKHLGDTKFTGALNSLFRQVLALDSEGERGKRSVYLSRNRQMLKGFGLNLDHPFDGVLRHPVSIQADRENAAATVTFPNIIPNINLHLPWEATFYQFVVSLGVVGDIVYNINGHMHTTDSHAQFHTTEWQHRDAHADEAEIRIQLDKEIPEDASLVLSIGIQMGMPDRFGVLEVVRYTGTAKVVEVF